MKMQGNALLTRGMTAGIAHEGELRGYNVGPGPWLALIPVAYIGGRDYWTGRPAAKAARAPAAK